MTRAPRLTTRSLLNCSKTRFAELFSGLFYVAASRFNSPHYCQIVLKHQYQKVSSTSCNGSAPEHYRAMGSVPTSLPTAISVSLWCRGFRPFYHHEGTENILPYHNGDMRNSKPGSEVPPVTTAGFSRITTSQPHLSRFIHAALGESMDLLGSVKPAEESKLMPAQSFWAQAASWKLRLELRIPVFEPVGGMAINSPVEVSSSRRSRLARHNSSNCSRVIMFLTFTNR